MPWESLEAIAREAEPGQAGRLLQGMSRLAGAPRDEALTAVAAALAAADPGAQVIHELAGLADRPARQLALELAARWPGQLDRGLIPSLRALLLDRSLPVGAQLATVVVLLQSVGKAGQPAVSLVRSFVTDLDKTQVVERLNALELRVGTAPAVEEVRARLDAKLSMYCPRCGKKLRRTDMGSHVWREHGLVLDGAMVREPWAVVEDWLADAAAAGNNPDLLARCFELVQLIDPERGLVRLERLLGDYGLDCNGTLTGGASSRCPGCSADVSVRRELPIPRLNISHGRLSHAGYLVDLSETGLSPRLLLETPEEVLFCGTEPGHWLTRRGACFLLAGLPVLAAWLVVLVGALLERPVAVPVAVLLTAALLMLLLVQASYRLREPVGDRAIDHAWTRLAPRLQAAEFSVADSAFLAGLAAASKGRGQAAQRERPLERLLSITERALAGRPQIVNQLASLRRLEVEDAGRLGRDPLPILARQVNRGLEGNLPLALADRLLSLWPGNELGQRAGSRLRVTVCQWAFENGATVADLTEASRLAPALGVLLGKREGLAHLQLLWSERTALPWEECGEAFTVFELAGPGGMAASYLEQYPDLLLYQFLPSQEAPAGPTAILVVSRGLVFGDVLFTKKPARIEIKPSAAAFELTIGTSRFAFRQHPGQLARRLERWFCFFFDNFLPKTPAVLAQSPAGLVRKLRFPEAVHCPRCRQAFLPKAAQTGIPLS